MTTKAYVISYGSCGTNDFRDIALVASPVLSVKMDVTARGQDGGATQVGMGGLVELLDMVDLEGTLQLADWK